MRDVIVIGTGAGGAVVAKELAARGLDVLLLEAGAAYPDPDREWTRFENDAINFYTGFTRFGPGDRSRRSWLRELPQACLLLQSSGVGGTTKIYAGNSPRAMPGVFSDYSGPDRDAYDTAHRFPFGYRELIPYYEWVERTLPVETAPMGRKEEAFFRGASRLGLPVQTTKDTIRAAYRPQENAILQPAGNAGRTSDRSRLVFPLAQGCTFCGHCFQGCVNPHAAPRNLLAKRSTDNSYVPMALTANRWSRGGRAATLITNAFVTRIDTDQQGAARGVTWRDGNTGAAEYQESAQVVVMASGAVETPRLWLNSGLPNPNNWVGRGLTDHFLDGVIGVMPYDIGTSKGPWSAARADFPGRGMLEMTGGLPADTAVLLTASNSGIAGYNGLGGVGRLVGIALKQAMAHVDRLLILDAIVDDDVEFQNGVSLSTSWPPDANGPIPRVEMHARARSARTVANRKFLVEQAVELLRAAGAMQVFRMNWPPVLLHLQSSMRMGASESDSVLDANAEARGVRRLFIADASALANAIGGPNPALTIQALATRTAEKIFHNYFGGDPWVGKEKAVPSIDPAVTLAVSERARSCAACHSRE